MTISRRKMLVRGATLGVVSAWAPSGLGAAPALPGLTDRYVATKDPGLKKFLAGQPQLIVPDNAPAIGMLAPPGEPGERMIVTGQVTDGRAPIAGVSLYIYNTDAKGFYNPGCPGCGNHVLIARLHAGLKTDAAGRYRFETVRPGPYDGGEQHIHVVVTTPEDGWQFEITFDDDPVVKAWLDGSRPIPPYVSHGNASIRHVARDGNGTWHLTQDMVLQK